MQKHILKKRRDRNRGRAGRTLLTFARKPNIEENKRGEEQCPYGSAWALTVTEPHPGGLSSWRERCIGLTLPTPTTYPTALPRPARSRRGRGLSLPTPTMPPLPVGRGRGRGFSPPSPSTPNTS